MSFNGVFGTLLGIVGFLFLILIHEGGHFLVSKSLGIRVNEFSVGMGPLLTSTEKNGTVYSFRALPIGGYCALEGEFPEDMDDEDILNFKDEDPTAFSNQSPLKQILVLIAGPFVNIVFGFILLVIVYSIVAAGYDVSFGRILQVSLQDCGAMCTEIFQFIGGLFNGSSSLDDVSGVIGVVEVVTEVANKGLINVLYLIALLSVNLCVMNLLPIPGLDGGRILVTLIKVISGGRLSPKAERIVTGIGTALLLFLIIFISIKDVIHIFN